MKVETLSDQLRRAIRKPCYSRTMLCEHVQVCLSPFMSGKDSLLLMTVARWLVLYLELAHWHIDQSGPTPGSN